MSGQGRSARTSKAEADAAADADAAAEAEAEAEAEAKAETAPEDDGPLPTQNELLQRGDAAGLMELAKAYRTGTRGVEQDLKACFACYRSAAELGHAPAHHALGVFYLTGRVVDRDERQAAASFRSAADTGFLPSRVFVANLYELGIHYSADPKKADVWYRSVARQAAVSHEEGTSEYALAMAELGCVRYCLALAEGDELSPDDRRRFLQKARAHGYRTDDPEPTRLSMSVGMNEPTLGGKVRIGDMEIDLDAELADVAEPSKSETTEAPVGPVGEPQGKPDEREKSASAAKPSADKPVDRKKPGAIQWAVGDGLTAFLYALIFAAVGVGGGYALTAGATEWLAQGKAVPLVGPEVHLILPLMIGVFAILPNLLVYRLKAIGKALLVGAVAAIAGEVLWGAGRALLADRLTQITIFATGGFLLGLLVLGVMGGAKRGRAPMPKS